MWCRSIHNNRLMAPICGVFLGLFFAGCMVSEPPIPPREALAEAANRIEDILLDETPGGPATPIMDCGERPEDPTRVSVWLYNDPVVSPVAADPRRRAALNRKHPNVTLDCQLAGPWMMAVQKLTVNLAAGDAGDLPDIALVKRFWLPRLARTGRLVPMDVLLPKSLLEDVREPSRAAFTVDGLLYAMPGEGFCNVLLYNKELLPAGPPATWDALRCTAKAMPRTKQDFDPIGDVPFLESLWSAGGAVYEDRQCDLRAPEASEALEFILGLRNSGLAHPAAIGDPERGRQGTCTGCAIRRLHGHLPLPYSRSHLICHSSEIAIIVDAPSKPSCLCSSPCSCSTTSRTRTGTL